MLQGSASQASRLGDLVMVKVPVAQVGAGGDAAVLTSSRVVLMLTPLAQDQVGTHHPSPQRSIPGLLFLRTCPGQPKLKAYSFQGSSY